jgi:hypothetical protein
MSGNDEAGRLPVIRYAATPLFAASSVALGSAGNVGKVNSTLRFEREVELHVADGTIIGAIEGIPPRTQ